MNMTPKRFKESLKTVLDEQFPKDRRNERYAALVLFDYACILHDVVDVPKTMGEDRMTCSVRTLVRSPTNSPGASSYRPRSRGTSYAIHSPEAGRY